MLDRTRPAAEIDMTSIRGSQSEHDDVTEEAIVKAERLKEERDEHLRQEVAVLRGLLLALEAQAAKATASAAEAKAEAALARRETVAATQEAANAKGEASRALQAGQTAAILRADLEATKERP